MDMTTLKWMEVLQPLTHYVLHLLLPGLISWLFFKQDWIKAWIIMLATMLVDLDHLMAYPDIFMADRCSIGFHPLHSYFAIGVYGIMLFIPKLRIVAIGLLIHMLVDFQDCLWMNNGNLT